MFSHRDTHLKHTKDTNINNVIDGSVELQILVDQVEAQISQLTEQALFALEAPTIEPAARDALTQLAIMATQRNS